MINVVGIVITINTDWPVCPCRLCMSCLSARLQTAITPSSEPATRSSASRLTSTQRTPENTRQVRLYDSAAPATTLMQDDWWGWENINLITTKCLIVIKSEFIAQKYFTLKTLWIHGMWCDLFFTFTNFFLWTCDLLDWLTSFRLDWESSVTGCSSLHLSCYILGSEFHKLGLWFILHDLNS